MFPLRERKKIEYNFGQKTWYSAHHLGQDYKAYSGEELYAPFDGEIFYTGYGSQSGNMIQFRANGVVFRLMHLKDFVNPGTYKKGDLIGHCDNTGMSTGAHLHLDIWVKEGDVNPYDFSGFIDPEQYNWEGDFMTEQEFREVIWNVVNGWYGNYLLRPASPQEVDAHTNVIMGFQPRKWAISEWVNRQKDEKEFKDKWMKRKDCIENVCVSNEVLIKENNELKSRIDSAMKMLDQAINIIRKE